MNVCVWTVKARAQTNDWSLNFIQLSTHKLPKSQRAFWLDRAQKVNGVRAMFGRITSHLAYSIHIFISAPPKQFTNCACTHTRKPHYFYVNIGAFESHRTRTTDSYKLHGCGEALWKIGAEHSMNIVVVTPISISVTIYISFDIRRI